MSETVVDYTPVKRDDRDDMSWEQFEVGSQPFWIEWLPGAT